MILVADSGSTKTHWALIHNNDSTRYETDGFNPFLQTTQEISAEIKKMLLPALPAGTEKKISHVYYYGAGCSVKDKQDIVYQAIKESFSGADIEVNHDLLGAARAACGRCEGIAAILGTGSNSCYYDGVNIIENVRSLGYMLGDEGSGMHLGKTFIQSYLYNDIPEKLKLKFDKAYRTSFDEILDNVYKKPFPNRYLASFSKFVYDNKEDVFIEEIINKCINMFFEKHICKYQSHKKVAVSFVGSVAFHYSSFINKIAQSKGIKVGSIIQSPIEALIQYHLIG